MTVTIGDTVLITTRTRGGYNGTFTATVTKAGPVWITARPDDWVGKGDSGLRFRRDTQIEQHGGFAVATLAQSVEAMLSELFAQA